MPQMRRATTILLLFAWSANASAGPVIQPLLESEMKSGCGCNFKFVAPNSEGSTFLWWLEGEDAYMRVDGALEKLSVGQTSGRSKKSGVISVGDTGNYVLSSKLVKVKVSTVVVQACSPKNIECESVGLKAIVKANTSGGTTTVNGTGACGC